MHAHATARRLRLKINYLLNEISRENCRDSHSLAFVVLPRARGRGGKRLILGLALRLPGGPYYPEVPVLELGFPYAFLYFQPGVLLCPVF